MNVYAVDKLMAEARRLAAEYRRVTGKTLPISGEIAVHDAARLLGLETVTDPAAGYDAVRIDGDERERFLVKARVVFDQSKGGHRLGELKLDKPWDTLLVVLMDADYEAIEIYAVRRADVVAALDERTPSRSSKKGTLTVPRIKIIGSRVWARDAGGDTAVAAVGAS
jgi:hypothetical protein